MGIRVNTDSKGLTQFLIFVVFLLYLIAIAILNINELVTYGMIHGPNPLPAFTPEFLAPTLSFFVVTLAFLMISTKSEMFKLEKGGLIKFKKKEEKGYNNWANPSDYKKELVLVKDGSSKPAGAGIALLNNGKELWVDNGEYHSLIIGSTGSGKTTIVVHPLVKTLALNDESMIITDPKGEIYKTHGRILQDAGYNIIILNFREPQQGNAWNPLMLPYKLYKEGNTDKANELLDDLAKNILYDDTSKGQDPFWENTAADYFTAMALALFADAKADEINLNSINFMSTIGEEKSMGKTLMQQYFDTKEKTSTEYINAVSTLTAPQDTKNSILSVFKQKIKIFSTSERISEMLSHSDFDMMDIGKKKTAVFLVVHDEKKTYHPLATTFIKQCYESLIDVAQQNPDGKLKYRTNFILDEFANMPKLKDVTTMVTAARSRQIRLNFIIQNYAQLYQVYGKEDGETIKGNCGNIIYLISTELSALEEISKLCGEVKSNEKDKTASTPLVTISDLQKMKMGEVIFLRSRLSPLRTKMTPSYKMEWFKNIEPALFPRRETEKVKVFDMKQYLQEKKGVDPESFSGSSSGGGFPSFMDFMNKKREEEKVGKTPSRTSREIEKPKQNELSDIDKMLADIDKQIEELEKKENNQKEEVIPKKEKTKIEFKEPIRIATETDKKTFAREEKPVVKKTEEKQTESIYKESDKFFEEEVTDDQFYDDFFEE